MKAMHELRVQLYGRHTLSAIDHQGKTVNTNIAEVKAKNVVFSLLMILN
jgi:hypothetical protein